MRNTASCVPLQVRVGGPVRLGQASSPVRLYNRSLDRPGRSARAAPGPPATPCPELAEGLVIVVQATLIVVDEHAGSDVRQ